MLKKRICTVILLSLLQACSGSGGAGTNQQSSIEQALTNGDAILVDNSTVL